MLSENRHANTTETTRLEVPQQRTFGVSFEGPDRSLKLVYRVTKRRKSEANIRTRMVAIFLCGVSAALAASVISTDLAVWVMAATFAFVLRVFVQEVTR